MARAQGKDHMYLGVAGSNPVTGSNLTNTPTQWVSVRDGRNGIYVLVLCVCEADGMCYWRKSIFRLNLMFRHLREVMRSNRLRWSESNHTHNGGLV